MKRSVLVNIPTRAQECEQYSVVNFVHAGKLYPPKKNKAITPEEHEHVTHIREEKKAQLHGNLSVW